MTTEEMVKVVRDRYWAKKRELQRKGSKEKANFQSILMDVVKEDGHTGEEVGVVMSRVSQAYSRLPSHRLHKAS